MKRALLSLLGLLGGVSAAEPPRPDVPMACFDKHWSTKHNYLSALALQASGRGPLDIYFLGDSITEFWPVDGKAVWEAEFGKLHVLNCGVSGDLTQNILFRVIHGEFEHIAPKVVVLLAGTNNLSTDPGVAPEAVARGVQRIVETLRAKSPASQIVVMSIFPSSERDNPIRARIAATNQRLAALGDGTSVFYLDLHAAFLDSEGNFPRALSPDGTHLSEKGFQIWADGLRPLLQKLLEGGR